MTGFSAVTKASTTAAITTSTFERGGKHGFFTDRLRWTRKLPRIRLPAALALLLQVWLLSPATTTGSVFKPPTDATGRNPIGSLLAKFAQRLRAW